jgi:osmoprotectant transport system substrate-binding protein
MNRFTILKRGPRPQPWGASFGTSVLRAAMAVALVLSLTGCSSDVPKPTAAKSTREPGSIVVASFDFAEGELLSDLYATILQEHGYPVRRAFNLGPREIVQPALQQGKVDIVPEYLGTALSFITLGNADLTQAPAKLYAQLQRHFRPRGIDALAFSSAQDENGIVVTDDTAAHFNLRTISDLKEVAPRMVFGGPPECQSRPFCLAGLEKTYGLHFREIQSLDTGGPLTVKKLETGEIDVGLLFTTDPTIVKRNFVLLRDDKDLQPADNVVPVVRRRVLKERGGGVIRLIDSVTRRLSTEALRRLNERVQLDGRPPHEVATEWLTRQGFIS